ncbi:Ig-like domain-containing protein [Pseudomonas frederiksbergensis]|uniref:Ig-like domain-containing protein n=1 Tax=Pseudomonas frederiksbergensis TaxID=104087 RepID=UPI003D1AB059
MWWNNGKSHKAQGARVLASPMIMSLEPRMLFDGAVAATVADAAQPDSHPTAEAAKAPTADHPTASKDTHGQADNASAATPAPAATPTAVPGQSVVFVDSRIKDTDSLLKGVAPGTEVVTLDATKDGLQQIAAYLDTHQGVSSVQIIAHGNAGDLWLGNSYLSADNVAERSDVLAQIGKDMNVGGDILIYACNTGADERGVSFVDSLAQLTGRDIAASTNRTGVGGDWNLEIATGSIESRSVLSSESMAGYQYSLATLTVVNNADSGVGSLRTALSSAVAGDTVTFSTSMIIGLNSQLTVTKNVTIDGDLNNDGVADVTLNGQYKTRVIQVNSGITATFDGLVIKQGMVAGVGAAAGTDGAGAMGGGILNSGNLTLRNVTITDNAASGGGGGGGVTAPYVGGAVGGGGGGGGALGGQIGGHGGTAGFGTGVYAGTAGGAGSGGNGGTYNVNYMGGKGGTTVGGAGGIGASNYSSGGTGGTATNGTVSIGGGGGGSGWDRPGRAGSSASGGIYNASTGTLTVVGTSVISNNVAAGGGGGGGGGLGGSSDNGGAAGKGVGAIWNKGTLLMTAANFGALAGNAGGSGAGGLASGGGTTGSVPAAVNNIFNDGGVVNTNYLPDVTPPTVSSIVVGTTNLNSGGTSLVTITFSEAVNNFTNADLTVANGTLSAVSSSDGGITWTATLTAAGNINAPTNSITLDTTGVQDLSGNVGTGSGTSNNYVIHDTVAPTASIVVSDNALNSSETSLVTITFSEAVTGFTNADLTIANGTLTAVTSGDGGVTWTATFTPTAALTDSTNLITLDKTGVQDLSGNAGVGVTNSNNYAIDTQRPTATIVMADTALKIGDTSLVTITFSEAVSGFTNADLTLANGTMTAVSSADGGITWTGTFTPSTSITDTTNVITLDNTGVQDLAGNAGTGTTNSANYTVDTARPTATIVVADTNLSAGETSLVTVTFSEAVSGFTNADLSIANGTLTAVSSADGGITWTATFTPTASVGDTTNVITLANTGVADLQGNAGSGTTNSNNYIVDTVRPTATIVLADTALKIGDTSLVTITFSQAVTGFTNADLTIANGTLTAVSSSDGGITWTATFTPTTSINDATNIITLDNTGIQATSSGNVGTGVTNSGNYTVDTVRPTASIVLADTALKIGDTSLVTITFSEAVSGFTNADLTIANGTLTAVSSADGGITWTATFTPSASITDATNVITLDNTGVQDLAGNAGSGTTDSSNYVIDTQRPTATIVLADPALSVGETSLVTITFSEAVSGFTNADLAIANGTLTAVSSGDGGITWTATFTPTAGVKDTTNIITLANTGIADLSGNAGTGTTNSGNYTVDTVAPTATIVVADNALNIGETSLVTITFSEAVTGFTNADLTIANGTLTAVSSSDGGITWTATFTPTSAITDASNLITLDNTGVQATVSGNVGVGSTDSNNYAIDTQRPTATIVVADPTLALGQTSVVTITFNEAVTGLTLADFTVENGSLSGLTTSDNITYTATFTPSGSVNDATNIITLNNTGVADVAGNVGAGTTDSNNYVIDSLRPTATIVVADPTLSAGETSLVTITFSEAVSGFDNSDLSIPNGTLSAVSSSDGGITWTGTFTPTVGVRDTTNLITLNNGGVADLAGNAGTGVTNSANFTIDTVLPTATIVVADNALNIGETSLVTITFSEAVSGFSNADLTIANGTLSAVSSSDGGITWTATFTPTSAVTDATNLITLDNSGVQNASGNAGTGNTDSNNYAIDTVRPTATIVVADPTLALGQTSLVTITFSEAVSGFTNADLSIANGTLTAVSSADGGITWTATFTPTTSVNDATNVITLDNTGVQDLAGNAGSGTTDSNNYVIDSLRPTATIVVADPTLSAGETSLVTITFSEAVSGFDNSDLSIPNGTLSAVSSSDGGITWTGTFTPTVGVRDTTNLITLNNGGVADLAGNAGAGVTNSANFTIDTVLPTATIVVADNALNIGETSLVTITFSEAVTGFSNADLTIANGTLSAVSSSDGGITWTATFTPTSAVTDASNLITLDNSGVQNASGNAGTGTTDSNNYAIDTDRPTATIVVADAALGVGQTTQVTITFSEAVSGFDNSDLTIDNGTLSNVTSSDGGITWTATLTPLAGITDTSNIVRLDNTGIQDLSGNTGSGTTDSNNYAIDSQRPTATIVLSDTTLKPGETSLVTITFSEAVSGFDNSDLTIANGTLSAVSSSDGGITWTATFTPTIGVTDATNVITLNNTGVADVAGNAGAGTTDSANYVVETQVPTATIVVADNALKAGETSLVTITFSEAVSGFTNADLTLANGTLSNVASSDGGITWTATFTPTVNVTDTTNLISLDNTGVINGSGNAGVGVTDSNNYAIDTARPTAIIVVADNRLGIGETTTVTITFTEAVSGFDLSDLSVANGNLSNLLSSDGGKTWTATLTPTANINDTTNLILLDSSNVTDAAGNAGAGIAISNNYALDATRPTATIVVANPNLGMGQTTLVTITFSEVVNNFDLSDLSVTNGELTNLASSDGGKTWTATFTPTASITDPSNFIALDTSNVSDLAGNLGDGVAVSNNYVIDGERPSATVVVANPNLGVGQTSLVTFTFNEAVSGFDLSDVSVANGTLSNLSSNDGGKTWTATLTPTSNLSNANNAISLNVAGVTDDSGNAGSGTSQSNGYAINTVPAPTATVVVVSPDPEFRAPAPVIVIDQPHLPLQPVIFAAPTGTLASPLTFAPLFEDRVLGDGIRPLGDIFINRGALAPSFIAQVFASSDSGAGDGSGHGFLGFGGGDGGVFGTSTLSSLFNQDTGSQRDSLNTFGNHSIRSGDVSQGLRGVFGAPSLSQQLQELKDTEQRQVNSLAAALQQVGISEMQA